MLRSALRESPGVNEKPKDRGLHRKDDNWDNPGVILCKMIAWNYEFLEQFSPAQHIECSMVYLL